MIDLNANGLLSAWEQGAAQPPVKRALMLLAAAWPEKSFEEWASVTVGERDKRLLNLREQLFGTQLEAVADCPQCKERLELAFSTEDIGVSTPSAPASLSVAVEGYQIGCRLPTSADLLAVSGAADQARSMLLMRCVQSAQRDGELVEVKQLPESVLKTVITEMANADPLAEVKIGLDCPSCRHTWSMDFDVLAYLWSEIGDWAARLLQDIHVLASSYGWSERDILGMSAYRRRLYLEMITGAR